MWAPDRSRGLQPCITWQQRRRQLGQLQVRQQQVQKHQQQVLERPLQVQVPQVQRLLLFCHKRTRRRQR